MRFAVAILVTGLFLVAPVSAKSPPPTAKVRQTALAQLRKSLAPLYADRTAAGRTKLIQALRQITEETDSDADRFVAGQEAAQLAAEAGDWETVLQIADGMGAGFELDVLKLKGEFLNLNRLPDPSEAGLKSLVRAHFIVVEDAIAEEQFEAATMLMGQAQRLTRTTRDAALKEELTRRTTLIREMSREHKATAPYRGRLEKNPADREASLAVGRYWCFARGDWETGLPLLRQGSDSALAQLAQADLTTDDTATSLVEVADQWWTFSDKARGLMKDEPQRHAAERYRQALPHLAGVEKSRIEKRLATAPAPRPTSAKPEVPLADVRDDPSLSVPLRVAKLVLGLEGRVTYRDSLGRERRLDGAKSTFADVPRDLAEIVGLELGPVAASVYPAIPQAVRLSKTHLQLLGRLSSLKTLSVAVHYQSADLEALAALKSLQSLSLTLTDKVRDDHLAFLKSLDQLESLSIRPQSSALTGDYLAHLLNHENCRRLYLGNIAIPLKLSERGRQHLAKLSNITDMGLVGSSLSVETVEILSALTKLQNVSFTSDAVPRLASLSQLTQLHSVSFDDTTFRAGDLSPLKDFPALKTVRFWRVDFLEGALPELCKARQLEEVTFAHVQFGADDFRQLSNLRNLKTLRIFQAAHSLTTKTAGKLGSGLSDANLEALKDMTSLEDLSIASLELTPAALKSLEGLSRLKKLDTRTYGGITQGDLDSLQTKLPDCVMRESSPKW